MKTRIISGLIMAPFLILVLLGGPLITVACLIIALMGIREFFNGFRKMEIHASYPVAVVSVVLLYGVHYLNKYLPMESDTVTGLYLGWMFCQFFCACSFCSGWKSDGWKTVWRLSQVFFISAFSLTMRF